MATRVGCSGWNYAHWRVPFYHGQPARRWLGAYAERFDTVEVNATFYRLPRRHAVAGWAEQTPAGFVFAVKVSRYLTHVRRLAGVGGGIRRLLERLEPLEEQHKLGPLLWQLPQNFARDDARLGAALEAPPPGYRHCFEFRHPSWFCEPVYRLLADADAALVIGDHPGRPFQTQRFPARWTYVRFHAGARGRRGNYSKSELEDWAACLRRWSRRGDVFAYFNNDWEAFAPRNAAALSRLLAGPGAARG